MRRAAVAAASSVVRPSFSASRLFTFSVLDIKDTRDADAMDVGETFETFAGDDAGNAVRCTPRALALLPPCPDPAPT